MCEHSVAVLDLRERSVVATIPTAAKTNGMPSRPPAFEIEIDVPEYEEVMPGMESME